MLGIVGIDELGSRSATDTCVLVGSLEYQFSSVKFQVYLYRVEGHGADPRHNLDGGFSATSRDSNLRKRRSTTPHGLSSRQHHPRSSRLGSFSRSAGVFRIWCCLTGWRSFLGGSFA
jgi:hypothetical protein